MKNIKLQYPFK